MSEQFNSAKKGREAVGGERLHFGLAPYDPILAPYDGRGVNYALAAQIDAW